MNTKQNKIKYLDTNLNTNYVHSKMYIHKKSIDIIRFLLIALIIWNLILSISFFIKQHPKNEILPAPELTQEQNILFAQLEELPDLDNITELK